jgi:hypothetical protein
VVCPDEVFISTEDGDAYELLKGDHVSTDVAVIDGELRWWRHVTGKSIGKGMFTTAAPAR